MGGSVYKDTFSAAEYREFSQRLEQQLTVLKELLGTPAFNRDEPSLGAELELYLVDDQYRPAAVNEELLELANHPQLTPELNRYNLEFNLSPVAAQGSPFAAMEKELRNFLDHLQALAQGIGANILPIGILPTLGEEHLKQSYMTDRPRYHALTKNLVGDQVKININGKDNLKMSGEGLTIEGANTSFQVHLRLTAASFARHYNAAQLTAPLALALAANSPLIAGMRLWQESRIALFKQSVDFREREHRDWRQPARVRFGSGWMRSSAWELFAENVAVFQPLLPVLFDTDQHSPPRLPELCMHHGTVWPWNRAVYESGQGGHVRIEFRALPAGPTILDMLANAALTIGWAVGVAGSADEYVARLPFKMAEYNFYRAAQHGLDARLLWPRKFHGGLEERPVTELIEEFLPASQRGLRVLGVAADDSARLWRIIEQRLETRTTGAAWQLRRFEYYRKSLNVDEASSRMLADYRDHVMQGDPVAAW
ncbi:MAG: glutamate--cysteine ligase [Halieaceae bacterium]|nr:glutamate--cysteine ligase [Halieaceae bacterium]